MKKNLISKILLYILMTLVAAFIFFPILWIISSSLKTLTGISTMPPRLIPSNPQFENYLKILQIGNIPFYFRNTLLLILGNTIGTLISSSLVAYPLARMNFKGKNVVFWLILATMMVPQTTTIIPQFLLFSKFNWIDTLYPLIVPAFFAYPYNVFLFRQFYKTIPKSMDESAVIDGCNRLQIFGRILVPLSKPIFITIGVMCAISWWNELLMPLIFINSDILKPLTVGALTVFKMHFQFVTMWNYQMALAVLMIIPPMVLYMFAQKYLIEGIKTTGMKG